MTADVHIWMHFYVPYAFIYTCELRKPLATLSLDYLLNMQTCDRMCKCACMAACLHALFPIFYFVEEWKVARFDRGHHRSGKTPSRRADCAFPVRCGRTPPTFPTCAKEKGWTRTTYHKVALTKWSPPTKDWWRPTSCVLAFCASLPEVWGASPPPWPTPSDGSPPPRRRPRPRTAPS